MSGFEKMKVFISSSINENSILLRKSLKIILENRGEFEVYVYEDSGPASHDNVSKYLYELDRSDVVIFLIDNKEENEEESVGVRKEFDRAKEKQKAALFYFSEEHDSTKTAYQEEIERSGFGGKYEKIQSMSEVLDTAYNHLKKDIFDTYRMYSANYISERENIGEHLTETVSAIVDIPIDMTNYTFDLLNSFIFDNENLNTDDQGDRNFDYIASKFLSILIDGRDIDDFNFNELYKQIETTITNEDTATCVTKRWDANQKYFRGEFEAAISDLKTLYNEYEDNKHIPEWLLSDILIDIRNYENVNNHENNIVSYNKEITDKLIERNQTFHPKIAHEKSQLLGWLERDRQKKETQSIYTMSSYGDLSFAVQHLTNIYFQALLYGSYTYLIEFLRMIQRTTYHFGQMTDNYYFQLVCLKVSSLLVPYRKIKQLFSSFNHLYHNFSTEFAAEVIDFSGNYFSSSRQFENQLKAFGLVVYYLSEETFEKYEKILCSKINKWFENPVVGLEGILFDTIDKANERINDKKLVEFGIKILESDMARYYDNASKMLQRNIDFSLLDIKEIENISEIILKRLREETLLINNISRADYLVIKLQKYSFNSDLDEYLKENHSLYYESTYRLELNEPSELNKIVNNINKKLSKRIEDNSKPGRIISYGDVLSGTLANLVEKDEEKKIDVELLKDSITIMIDGINSDLSFDHQVNLYESMLKILIIRDEVDTIKYVEEISPYNYSGMRSQSEHFILEFFNEIIFEIFTQKENNAIINIFSIPESKLSVSILRLIHLYAEIKDRLSVSTKITLFNFVINSSNSESISIKKEAVYALIPFLTDDMFKSNASKKISELMTNDSIEINLSIVSKINYINKESSELGKYVIQQVKQKEHYMLNKLLDHTLKNIQN